MLKYTELRGHEVSNIFTTCPQNKTITYCAVLATLLKVYYSFIKFVLSVLCQVYLDCFKDYISTIFVSPKCLQHSIDWAEKSTLPTFMFIFPTVLLSNCCTFQFVSLEKSEANRKLFLLLIHSSNI